MNLEEEVKAINLDDVHQYGYKLLTNNQWFQKIIERCNVIPQYIGLSQETEDLLDEIQE